MVIAAKSFARFKHFDSKVFAKYYLTRTLASVTLAIGGIILRTFWICFSWLLAEVMTG